MISLKNPIVEFNWLGWRTNTYELSRFGWDVSASQIPENNLLQFALRHKEANVRGVSASYDFEYYRYFHDAYKGNFALPMLPVRLASDLRVIESLRIDRFFPVETVPQMEYFEERSIDDFNIFKSIPVDTQDVYLQNASMAEILEFALKKQAPKQQEIRERMMKEQRLQKLNFNSTPTAVLRLVA